MATTTTNLSLTKPAATDAADISVLNANFDKIDALGGFGLGKEQAAYIPSGADLNTYVKNGWYYWSSGVLNVPFNSSSMLVMSRAGDYTHQIVFRDDVYDPCICIRKQTAGGWREWEYVNPPMALNVEYRTTKRYLGKPVYTKMIPFGALPNKTAKLVEVGGIGIVDAVSTLLVGTDGTAFAWTNHPSVTGVFNTVSSVQVYTSADLSAFNANCILEYTKN